MYSFMDNWVGNVYRFPTLRQAKAEAKKHTCGHSIVICSMCESQGDCRNCEWVKIAREMNNANE